MKNIKSAIEFLRNKLRYWEYLYYIENSPEISDDEYDRHMQTLFTLESKYPNLITVNSPTQCVGGGIQHQFFPICHIVPMLSLDHIFDEVSLLNFDKKIHTKLYYKENEKISYCCELKIDGVGISLIYKDGMLVHGATRGNGRFGEDVTKNVRTIQSIPLFLQRNEIFPDFLEVRGEVFMSNDCFLKLNQEFRQKGDKMFSNPRNAASGSLRQIDPLVTSNRFLDFFCYNVSYFKSDQKNVLSDSHWEQLQQCNEWGIPIIKKYTCICVGVDSVFKYFKNIQKIRSFLKFNIDGIVIKVDSISLQRKLGVSLRSPKWSVSYKFPPKKFISIVCDVRFQVNRIGVLVPVASINPTLIDGVVIKNISLYNLGIIRSLGIMIGDSVIVERVGDVIPKISKVIFSYRKFNKVHPIIYPDCCPACKSILFRIISKKTIVLRCNAGLYCFAQRKEILKHFVSRKAMNIVGMGDKIIDRLIKFGILHTPVDFFELNMDRLSCIDGIKEKLAKRLLNAVAVSKETTFSRFVYALGIPHVGEVTAFSLENAYSGSIDRLFVADVHSLLLIKDIGSVAAHSIFNFFRNDNNLQIVKKLLSPSIGIRWIND